MSRIPSRWRRFVEVAAAHGDDQATRLLVAHKDASRRVKAKSAPRRKAVRASKEQRRENLATTRAVVWERSRGICECCGDLAGDHLHHLHGGRGKRRKFEGPNACTLLCVGCHNDVHSGVPFALVRMEEIARVIDAPFEVQASLSRRLQKATR